MTRVAQNLGSSYKLEVKVIWDFEIWILLELLETWGHLTLPFLGGSCFCGLSEEHSPSNVSTPESDFTPQASQVF